MPTLNYKVELSGLGAQILGEISRAADGGDIRGPVTIPKGKAGTLSTRTDANTGIATVASGHGITTSDLVDVYWDGGMRYGMTVTAAGSTTISFDGGAGDNLPILTNQIVVSKQIDITLSLDGDNAAIVGLLQKFADTSITAGSHVDFRDGSASVVAMDLQANAPQVYDIEGGAANPFAGNVILHAVVSNGSSTDDATFTLMWLVDATL